MRFSSPIDEERHLHELIAAEEDVRSELDRERRHGDIAVDAELVPTAIKRAES